MALTQDVDVCNITLGRIGEDDLTTLDQTGRVARIMRNNYAPSRDSLIRQYRWNFAITRASLAPVGADDFGFAYKFNLPDDCLHLVGIFDADEDTRNYTSTKQPFKVEGRQLKYDQAVAYIYYLRAVTNVREMDPLFVDALAWKLGIDTAFGITTGPDMVKTCWTGFKEVIRMARLANAIEGSPEVITSSEWLDARSNVAASGFRAGPIDF